jgi:hypothetical protein
MLHYDLIYSLLALEIVWGQGAKALTELIFTPEKRALRYIDSKVKMTG